MNQKIIIISCLTNEQRQLLTNEQRHLTNVLQKCRIVYYENIINPCLFSGSEFKIYFIASLIDGSRDMSF